MNKIFLSFIHCLLYYIIASWIFENFVNGPISLPDMSELTNFDNIYRQPVAYIYIFLLFFSPFLIFYLSDVRFYTIFIFLLGIFWWIFGSQVFDTEENFTSGLAIALSYIISGLTIGKIFISINPLPWMNEAGSPSLSEKLLARASNLQAVAYFLVAMIAIVLTSAVYFIINAGELTLSEAQIANPYLDYSDQRFDLVERIRSLQDENDRLIEQLRQIEGISFPDDALEIKSALVVEAKTVIDSKLAILERIQCCVISLTSERQSAESTFAISMSDIKLNIAEIGHLRSQLDEVQARLNLIGDKHVEYQLSDEKRIDPYILLTTAVLRLGIVLVAIYLVQILVQLYKYNVIVASKYRAISDILVSDARLPKDANQLMQFFYPEVVLGKTPSSAMETISKGFLTSLAAVVGTRVKDIDVNKLKELISRSESAKNAKSGDSS